MNAFNIFSWKIENEREKNKVETGNQYTWRFFSISGKNITVLVYKKNLYKEKIKLKVKLKLLISWRKVKFLIFPKPVKRYLKLYLIKAEIIRNFSFKSILF